MERHGEHFGEALNKLETYKYWIMDRTGKKSLENNGKTRNIWRTHANWGTKLGNHLAKNGEQFWTVRKLCGKLWKWDKQFGNLRTCGKPFDKIGETLKNSLASGTLLLRVAKSGWSMVEFKYGETIPDTVIHITTSWELPKAGCSYHPGHTGPCLWWLLSWGCRLAGSSSSQNGQVEHTGVIKHGMYGQLGNPERNWQFSRII